MKEIDELLRKIPGELWYFGKSALDRYEKNKPPVICVAVTAGLGELAGAFEDLFFPGLEEADAAVVLENRTLLFLTVESLSTVPSFSLAPFNIVYSLKESRFIDRRSEYELLKSGGIQGEPLSARDWSHYVRYLAGKEEIDLPDPESCIIPASFLREKDRFFLEDVLGSPMAERALDFLFRTGWIKGHFPLLAELAGVEQNKEFHPEGNVWEHTLETLKYRKERPLNLSLALLFHDLGKGRAEEVGSNRFHGHAQIGAGQLAPILREWDFSEKLIGETVYLVAHHMMPAAIARLPYYKKKEAIEDPLFPLLLELYRCDLSSSFHGLDGYYDACRHYKAFRKNRQNPYRQADGSLKRGAS